MFVLCTINVASILVYQNYIYGALLNVIFAIAPSFLTTTLHKQAPTRAALPLAHTAVSTEVRPTSLRGSQHTTAVATRVAVLKVSVYLICVLCCVMIMYSRTVLLVVYRMHHQHRYFFRKTYDE